MGYQVTRDPADRLQAQSEAREDLLVVASCVLNVPEDHPWARSLAEQMLSVAMRGWEAFQQHRVATTRRAAEAMAAAARQ